MVFSDNSEHCYHRIHFNQICTELQYLLFNFFVCNCNGVRQRDMSAAVDHVAGCGAPTVDAVYAQCGVAPKCGRCKVDIQRMLDEAMRPALAVAAE